MALLGVGPTLALAQQPAPPPVEVTTVSAAPQTTPATFEFTGKTESSRSVEIRARVEGYLDKIAYTEGDFVRTGQLLFQLDPQPFPGRAGQCQGRSWPSSRSATGQRPRTPWRVSNRWPRKTPSAKRIWTTRWRPSVSASAGAGAVRQGPTYAPPQLNLGYTTIRSPLNGLSSKSEFRQGSLVTPGASSLLTTVLQLDPIWVSFGAGENDVLKFRQQKASGQLKAAETLEVELVLADGSTYPQQGADRPIVDPMVNRPDRHPTTIRAEVPNPNHTSSAPASSCGYASQGRRTAPT
ncbi:MAG: biotin/lipoyl-binding protein [Candidatus Competibacter sp.]